MLRFGRVADKVFNWTNAGKELHKNLVELQEQIYPPALNDGEDRPVYVHRDPDAVHDATCKECGEQVVGVRYKCGVCVDHDICSRCEANGVHDKHITFRFAGVVNEISSWMLVEQRFGVKLHDGLKALQRKITGPRGTSITSKDIDDLYAAVNRKKPRTAAEDGPLPKKPKANGVDVHRGPLLAIGAAPEGTRIVNVTDENVAPTTDNGVAKNELNATTAHTSQATTQPEQSMPDGSAQLDPTPTATAQDNHSAAVAPQTTSSARGPVSRCKSPGRLPANKTVNATTAQTSQSTPQPEQAVPNGCAQLDPTPTATTQDNRSAAVAPQTTSSARGPNVKRSKSPARSGKVRNGNLTHRVQCDECWAAGSDDPIVGVRYKCAVCEHFDLCAKCEQRGLHDHHVMLRFGRVADKILNWSADGKELHENLVKLQEQIYPPGQTDGEGRPVYVHRDPDAVHDVTCKECGEQVVGVRFKCGVCPNHDICSKCEANGVHDKHITFRFAGVANELTSWKQVERRFGVKLVDELKSLQHKVAGTTAAKPTSNDLGETSKKSKSKVPSGTTQEPPKTLADALKEVESAARAARMRELSEIGANLDLIKSGDRIGEALEQLDNASMAGGRLSYLGAWNTVSAVRNYPQHGAAARRLLAKWAAMADAEAHREAIRNSLRNAAAQVQEGSQAPQCSRASVTEANAAPSPDNGAVENESPPTPDGGPYGDTEQVERGGAAPHETADVPQAPLPKKRKSNGVGAHGGPLPATGTAPDGPRNGNVNKENVAPTADNGAVKNEPPPTPDGVPPYGTQQDGRGGAVPHETNGAPDVDMELDQSTLLSLASYVAHARGHPEADSEYEDSSVPKGAVKSEALLNPDDLPVEAVEALTAAIVALASERQVPQTVKIEPPPPPVNTPNVNGQLFGARNDAEHANGTNADGGA